MGLKRKTIKSILTKKVNEWIASIEDETLREKLKKSVIVTGGAIVSMLLDEKVHDFDIYLRDKEAVLGVANYYVERFKHRTQKGIDVPLSVVDDGDRVRIVAKSAGIASEQGTEVPYQYFENSAEGESETYIRSVIDNPEQIADTYEETEEAVQEISDKKHPYRPVFLTSNAITLSDKIQIVIRFYGEPEQIHENFDFQHCANFYTHWNHELILRPEALECILAKELRYVGSKYPICSLVRLRKFLSKNWKINAGQILKIALQVSDLDLTNIEVLADQTLGVDAAYYVEVIEKIRTHNPEKVDTAYLVEILDRIFG